MDTLKMPNSQKPVRLTVVTATKPKDLSKGYYLGEGELQKRSGGVLVQGHAKVFPLLHGLDDLKTVLLALQSPQALIYGVPKGHSSIKIMSVLAG